MLNYIGIKAAAAAVVITALAAAGCGSKVWHRTDDGYLKAAPTLVAVLPVIMPEGMNDDKDAPRIKELFRTFAVKELRARGYNTVTLRRVDEAYVKLAGARFKDKGMENMARETGADAVLAVDVEKWSRTAITKYVSLKIAAECTLYGASGKELWRARHKTSDSEISLDKEKALLDITVAFEPRIESIISAIFMTLPYAPEKPDVEAPKSDKKYFDWLP